MYAATRYVTIETGTDPDLKSFPDMICFRSVEHPPLITPFPSPRRPGIFLVLYPVASGIGAAFGSQFRGGVDTDAGSTHDVS